MSQEIVPFETTVLDNDERLLDEKTIQLTLSIPMLRNSGIFNVRGLSIPNSFLNLSDDKIHLTITLNDENDFLIDDKISGYYFSSESIINVVNEFTVNDVGLPDDEIDEMANEAARFLPTKVFIYRNRGGDNQQGGESAGKDIIGSNIPARLAPISQRSSLVTLADKMQVKFPWILTLPANVDIEDEDEIHWNNRFFIVVVAIERDYKVTMRLLCDEIMEK